MPVRDRSPEKLVIDGCEKVLIAERRRLVRCVSLPAHAMAECAVLAVKVHAAGQLRGDFGLGVLITQAFHLGSRGSHDEREQRDTHHESTPFDRLPFHPRPPLNLPALYELSCPHTRMLLHSA